MKVELRIDPGCDGMSVVINAPALTDEVKALAARLEGGGVLVGWQRGRAVPLAAEDILRCYGEEKGVKCQTPGGVYDLKERLTSWRAGWTGTPSCASPTRRSSACGRSPPWISPLPAPSG
ncbi:MAG: hypothetical protein ACLT5P_11155 [Flavonifractor plautii]